MAGLALPADQPVGDAAIAAGPGEDMAEKLTGEDNITQRVHKLLRDYFHAGSDGPAGDGRLEEQGAATRHVHGAAGGKDEHKNR